MAEIPGPATPPKSILIVKPGSLGDIMHALPCAAAIRRAWPTTKMAWLIDSRWRELLEGNPLGIETVDFPREKFRGPLGALRSLPWAFGLGALQPSVAVDLQGLLRSALIARFSRARRIHGLSDAREGAGLFYQAVTPVLPHEHAVHRYLRILSALGISPPETPAFPLPEGTLPSGIAAMPPFLLLHPFARGKGKSLSAEHVETLCRHLRPLPIVLAGQGRMDIPLPDNAVNFLNRTSLHEFIGLARVARFTISVDSGPMHIAAAISPNLLSIHTWSDPHLVGPCHEDAWIWQGGEIRRQSLSPSAPLLPPRRPRLSEMASIAKWVTEHIS